MLRIIWIVTLDSGFNTIDKLVYGKRGAQVIDMVNNLLHLGVGQRIVAKMVTMAVVLKENISPILYKFALRWITEYILLPATCLQFFNQRGFKFIFFIKM